ncbi:hypothetical protein ABTL75_18285 [Acinetobacter baumannii]|uniref:hypothetical protein n=1 Tax=Acinetobacter baumannii TaxID=470 RepID=UPI0011205FF2|nr:hypothetical protein [Acinetobacter baumannii]
MTFITAAEASEIATKARSSEQEIIDILSKAVQDNAKQGIRRTTWNLSRSKVELPTLERVKAKFVEGGYSFQILSNSPETYTVDIKF